jgi:hypothetical protein
MTDRELLERAAKAAGLRYIKPTEDYSGALGLALCDEHERWTADWNPLADDGDALRLAVRLNMTVQCSYSSVWVERAVPATEVVETHNNKDPLAATRRAIVRAAATLADSEPT